MRTGERLLATSGIVSGYREFVGQRFVQLDASVNPGNSGGPALDAMGHIIGIASWKVSHVSMEGLAFAVPADLALELLGLERAKASSADWQTRRGSVGELGLGASKLRKGPIVHVINTLPDDGKGVIKLARLRGKESVSEFGVTLETTRFEVLCTVPCGVAVDTSERPKFFFVRDGEPQLPAFRLVGEGPLTLRYRPRRMGMALTGAIFWFIPPVSVPLLILGTPRLHIAKGTPEKHDPFKRLKRAW